MNCVFYDKNLKFPARGSDLAPFLRNGTKIKIPFEIKPPLPQKYLAIDISRPCFHLNRTIMK